jgi:FkbM family methyltransferase
VEILALLAGMNISSAVYIDVGANHPMSISNTYLLYRKGCWGVVVEPNLELAMLFERHRPRDVAIAAACSDKRGVARFTLSKTPILSAFDPNRVTDPWRNVLVPVITVDDIIAELDPAWVSLLTVDVEGESGAVLRGATQSLERTLVVCVEAAPGAEEEQLGESLASTGFQVVRYNGTNIIAVNVDRARFDRFRAR